MREPKRRLILAFVPFLMLSGCKKDPINPKPNPTTSDTENPGPSKEVRKSNINWIDEPGDGSGYREVDISGFELERHQSIAALGEGLLPSIGASKLLVVPVTFKNLDDEFTAEELSNIERAFTSETLHEEGSYYSLKKYYEISSYGKLDLGITVTNPFTYGLTTSQFQAQGTGPALKGLLKAIAKWLETPEGGSLHLQDYDSDKDGYLDGVEIIYKTDRTWDGDPEDPEAIWWNYTSLSGLSPNPDAPAANYYFFSNFSEMMNGYYQDADENPLPDTHTIIHETGHMLGLDDYYSYDYDENVSGGVDMMDYNVGDHGAYTKMILGWVNPLAVDGTASEFDVTLRPFTESGDCLILKEAFVDPWNGTPYDEYLLLQYYTPTSLNEFDCHGNPEWKTHGHGGTYENAGLQVYHIDARVYSTFGPSERKLSSGITYVDYLYDYAESDGTYFYDEPSLATSNTASYSLDVEAGIQTRGEPLTYGYNGRLLSCIQAGNKEDKLFGNSKAKNYFVVQSNLFGLPEFGCGASSFSMEEYKAFFHVNDSLFNDGSEFPYSFSVTAQDSESITIHVVEN